MKPALKKTLAVIVAIVVFVLIAALAGVLEGLYQTLFPDLSERALRNIEAISNIIGIALAVILSIMTYKRLTKTQGDQRGAIRNE